MTLFLDRPLYSRRPLDLLDNLLLDWGNLITFDSYAPIALERTNDSLVATMELPGVERKDIEVRLLDGVVTVSGERKGRTRGSFIESFTVPKSTKATQVSAALNNGLLTVTVKVETPVASPAAVIPVS